MTKSKVIKLGKTSKDKSTSATYEKNIKVKGKVYVGKIENVNDYLENLTSLQDLLDNTSTTSPVAGAVEFSIANTLKSMFEETYNIKKEVLDTLSFESIFELLDEEISYFGRREIDSDGYVVEKTLQKIHMKHAIITGLATVGLVVIGAGIVGSKYVLKSKK